jgi:hypothetical protein
MRYKLLLNDTTIQLVSRQMPAGTMRVLLKLIFNHLRIPKLIYVQLPLSCYALGTMSSSMGCLYECMHTGQILCRSKMRVLLANLKH